MTTLLEEEKVAAEDSLVAVELKLENPEPNEKSFEGIPYPSPKPVQAAEIAKISDKAEPKPTEIHQDTAQMAEAPKIEEKDFVEQILNQAPGKISEPTLEVTKSEKAEIENKLSKPDITKTQEPPPETVLKSVVKTEEPTTQKIMRKEEPDQALTETNTAMAKPLNEENLQKITDQSILKQNENQELQKPEISQAKPKNPATRALQPLETVDLEPVKAVPVEHTATADIPRREKPEFRDSPSNKIDVWNARRKTTLKDALLTWCAQEKIHCILKTKNMYELERDVFINGTFKNAIDILFSKGLRKPPEYKIVNDGEDYRLIVQDESATL
ncbi:MAG: hypothetical protein GC137_07075 [Alphaproteobacteria bacterium]|nr:hypothetical protein [Alphaproteobacteria bacterium]